MSHSLTPHRREFLNALLFRKSLIKVTLVGKDQLAALVRLRRISHFPFQLFVTETEPSSEGVLSRFATYELIAHLHGERVIFRSKPIYKAGKITLWKGIEHLSLDENRRELNVIASSDTKGTCRIAPNLTLVEVLSEFADKKNEWSMNWFDTKGFEISWNNVPKNLFIPVGSLFRDTQLTLTSKNDFFETTVDVTLKKMRIFEENLMDTKDIDVHNVRTATLQFRYSNLSEAQKNRILSLLGKNAVQNIFAA